MSLTQKMPTFVTLISLTISPACMLHAHAHALRYTIAGGLEPRQGAPAHVDEADRVARKPPNWTPAADADASARAARTARIEYQAGRLTARETARREEEGRVEAREARRRAALAERALWYADHALDSQQVFDSRNVFRGRETILTEPAPDRTWHPAAPHLTSNWQTISGNKNLHDPPDRSHVKKVTSDRRYFASMEAGRRPLTPRKPQWGGDLAPLAPPVA